MKYLLKLIFILPFLANGQLLKPDDGELTVYDTTAIFKTVELTNRNILIICPDYSIKFDRDITIASIDTQIKELESEGSTKDWQFETIQQIKRTRNYLASRQTHTWTDFWSEGELIPLDEIKDDELLTMKLFWELACPMLDEGQFELTIDSERQNQILKTTSNINGATATVFVTENGIAFWMCPPITMD